MRGREKVRRVIPLLVQRHENHIGERVKGNYKSGSRKLWRERETPHSRKASEREREIRKEP